MFNMRLFEIISILLCVAIVHGNKDVCPTSVGTFGPTIGMMPMITSYISVDSRDNGSTICRMEYLMPANATLWQGMLAASQQHGDNFTFESTLYPPYGHFVTTINELAGNAQYFWALQDGEGDKTPVGVDFLYPESDSSFIWSFDKITSGDHNASYNGSCLDVTSIISPTMPLTYIIAYLTVSDENTGNFVNGTMFKPVCKQLVLFNASQASLLDVITTASEQVPIQISSTIMRSELAILNTLSNQAGYTWAPFNATTDMMLPLDLTMTDLTDGDHILFRFIEMETGTTMKMTTAHSPEQHGLSLILSVAALIVASFVIN